jgi:AraC-like DNA-binding protein
MQGFKQFFAAPIPEAAAFRIRGIGVHERMRPCLVDRRAGTPDYLFMCFHDAVQVWEPAALRDVAPPSLVIWEPRHRHGYGNPGRAWDHSWIHCEGPLLPRMLRRLRLPLNRAFPLPDPLLLERTLIDLHTEVALHRRPDPEILAHTFAIFLRHLARSRRAPDAPAPVPGRLLAVKTWIDTHFDEPVTLAGLAAMAHLSVPHFCGEFKRCFGSPAIDHLIRVRMQAAVHHLGDSNRSITEVARLAGYENLFHFSRIFKQRFGVSPRAMRAKLTGGA